METESSFRQELITARHPLRQWCVYVTILGTVTVLGVGKQLLIAIRTDQTGLCLLIALIFLAALMKSLFDTVYLHRQMRLASEQIRVLWSKNNVLRFLESTSDSLLRQHIYSLWHIYRRDTQIDQDNLVTLLSARLNSRGRLIDLCSSVLVTLGLVGTIIGLIVATGGLSLVIENVGGDNQKLLFGMKDTLGGMGTAFYTTLLGAILGSVFLRFIGSLIDATTDALVAHVAQLTEVHILPVLRSAARVRERETPEAKAALDDKTGDVQELREVEHS